MYTLPRLYGFSLLTIYKLIIITPYRRNRDFGHNVVHASAISIIVRSTYIHVKTYVCAILILIPFPFYDRFSVPSHSAQYDALCGKIHKELKKNSMCKQPNLQYIYVGSKYSYLRGVFAKRNFHNCLIVCLFWHAAVKILRPILYTRTERL